MVKRGKAKLDLVGERLLLAALEMAKWNPNQIPYAVNEVTKRQPGGSRGYFRRELLKYARKLILAKARTEKARQSGAQVSVGHRKKDELATGKQGVLF